MMNYVKNFGCCPMAKVCVWEVQEGTVKGQTLISLVDGKLMFQDHHLTTWDGAARVSLIGRCERHKLGYLVSLASPRSRRPGLGQY